MGNIYLLGQDSETWSRPDVLDLITLDPRLESDPFSTWVSDSLLPFYHQTVGRLFRVDLPHSQILSLKSDKLQKPLAENMVSYTDKNVLRIASVFSTSIACGLPVACIVVLYYITTMLIRLIVIGVFTIVFAFGLGLVTTARQVDVFTATAAYVRPLHI